MFSRAVSAGSSHPGASARRVYPPSRKVAARSLGALEAKREKWAGESMTAVGSLGSMASAPDLTRALLYRMLTSRQNSSTSARKATARMF